MADSAREHPPSMQEAGNEIVCSNCSTPLPDWSRYCNACGTPVPESGDRPHRTRGLPPTDLRKLLQHATEDEYEIHDILGRGGMGSVFLAREIELDRLVALKVLPPNLMFDASLVERFKREAQTAAKLRHPNIIPVYRVHDTRNLAFFSMHFVQGRALSEILKDTAVLPVSEVERILLEAAAGLGYAHKRGVVHRDIKPANILIDAENHVHLTDFGISRALAGSTQLTETGTLIGTPNYMAPEQIEGRPVDGRADQYSLAVVGYQILAGRCPFEADSMRELFYKHLFTPPRPLDEVRPETPPALRDSIHKALSKDPLDRFDTMEDFVAGVEGRGPPIYVRWLDEEPTLAANMGRRASDTANGGWPALRGAGSPRGAGDEQPVGVQIGRLRAAALLALGLVTAAVVAVSVLTGGRGSETIRSALASLDGRGTEVASARPEDRGGDVGDAETSPTAAVEGPTDSGEGSADTESDAAGVDRAADAGSPSVVEPVTRPPARPVDRAQPRARPRNEERATTSQRPAVPRELTALLHRRLSEGRIFHDAGRYLEAADVYNDVLRRVDEASKRYRNASVLGTFVAQADSALAAASLACNLENQPSCP